MPGRDGTPLRVHHYHAGGAAPSPLGLVVLAPGSRGGMGPGQLPATLGKFHPALRSTYTVLARQLVAEGAAVCHLTWRTNPTRPGAKKGTLKAPQTLLDGASDIADAACFLRAAHAGGGALPLVLVGFSYGGPTVMAAAAMALLPAADPYHVQALGRMAGVVTLGCGMRVRPEGDLVEVGRQLKGGASRAAAHEGYLGCDSQGCVEAFEAAGLPLCMVHGLQDVTVDPMASAAIFELARGPKAAVWVRGGDHHMRSRLDEVVATLVDWVRALLRAGAVGRPAEAPLGLAGLGVARTL